MLLVHSTFALLLLLACNTGAEPADSDSTTSTPSTGTTTPTGSTTPTSPSTTAGTVAGERLTLVDGEVIEGELIAVSDQSLWWDAADKRWLVIFDPAGIAPTPDDRRLRFVPESEVVSRESVVLTQQTWSEHLRALGVTWLEPPLANVSHVLRGNDGYHLEEDGYSDFAWDLVRTDASGVRYTGSGVQNEDFLVWNAPVYASAGGVVMEVVRGAVDNAPGAYPAGAVDNRIRLRIDDSLYASYLHFRQDSIPEWIDAGATVQSGDLLGRVGNSGVTLEPHLHLTVHYWASDGQGGGRMWSVPSEWADLHHAQAPSGSTSADWWVPQTGEWVSAAPF